MPWAILRWAARLPPTRVRCVVGRWQDSLDSADRKALKAAIPRMSRADLYGIICAASGDRPFGLTALKDCINGRCVCD